MKLGEAADLHPNLVLGERSRAQRLEAEVRVGIQRSAGQEQRGGRQVEHSADAGNGHGYGFAGVLVDLVFVAGGVAPPDLVFVAGGVTPTCVT